MVDKNRLRVVGTGEVEVLQMTDEIREKMEEDKMSKDVDKMDKRIKELQDENVKLYEQWKQAGDVIAQQQNFQQQIVTRMNENAGAAKEISQWKTAISAKEDKNKK